MEAYTYKQVLLALREEYQKNEKRLDELKKHVTVNDTVEDYAFFIDGDDEKKYVELYLKTKQSGISKCLEKISLAFSKKEEKKLTPISHDFNGKKNFLVTPENNAFEIDDMNSLLMDCDRILNTTFAKNIHQVVDVKESKFKMTITSSGIYSYTDYKVSLYPSTGLLYKAAKDKLILTAYEDTLYYSQLKNILDIDIPFEELSDYHKSIIEKSNDKDKKMVLKGLEASRLSQYFKFESVDNETIEVNKIKQRG